MLPTHYSLTNYIYEETVFGIKWARIDIPLNQIIKGTYAIKPNNIISLEKVWIKLFPF